VAKTRGSPLRLAKAGDALDVGVYNPARYVSVCPADATGRPATPEADWSDRRAAEAIVARGELLYAQLCEDNDFVARFRLGDCTPQEDNEWVCRMVGKLSLPRGKLWCNRVVVAVPPGDYLADVRCYLPYTTASYALEWAVTPKVWDAQAFVKYWEKTRRGRPRPGWLVEWLRDRADDPEEAARLEEELGDRADERYVHFLVRLAPLPARVGRPALARNSFFGETPPRGVPKPGPDAPYCCVWECRQPAACPEGIRAGRVRDPGI
jgi:hypothetical protein